MEGEELRSEREGNSGDARGRLWRPDRVYLAGSEASMECCPTSAGGFENLGLLVKRESTFAFAFTEVGLRRLGRRQDGGV